MGALASVEFGMNDEFWMHEALKEADKAAAMGEVPIGCIILNPSGEPVARTHNLRQTHNDPTAHAEVLALRVAAQVAGTWRLDDYALYVTLEPCPMCAGALVNSRIGRVVYGCIDAKAGAIDSLYQLGRDPRLNHRFTASGGILAAPCAERLSRFFAALRALGKK